MVALCALCGGVGMWNAEVIRSELDELFAARLPRIIRSIAIDRDLHELVVLQRALVAADATEGSENELAREYTEKLSSFRAAWTQMQRTNATDDERVLIGNHHPDYERWLEFADRAVGPTSAGLARSEREQWLARGRVHLDALLDCFATLEQNARTQAHDSRRHGESSYVLNWYLSLLVVTVSLGVGVVVAWRITRGILSSLRGVIARVRTSSGRVGFSSTSVLAANVSMTETAASQAGHVQHVASTLRDLAAENAGHSQDARRAANEARARAERLSMNAEEVVSDLTDSMDQILRCSQRIEGIVQIINDIAFQTNLLALNAAVEAERSGEHGRGFRVVAAEVRELSQRTSEAVQAISELVTENVRKCGDGSNVLERFESTFASMKTDSRSSADLLARLSLTSQDQAHRVAELNGILGEIESTITLHASQAREGASTSERLSGEANALVKSVEELESLLDDAQPEATPTAVRARG